MPEGDGEGKLPQETIGDQCLPLSIVCDERLKMSLQQIRCDRHQNTPRLIQRYSGKESPNIGRPLLDCSRVASSWMTSQCSTRTPPSTRRMSAAIQFMGAPNPENRPWTMTISPSATIIPGSYFSVGGMLLIRSNRPSRPGPMCALC